MCLTESVYSVFQKCRNTENKFHASCWDWGPQERTATAEKDRIDISKKGITMFTNVK
jgi:hypothetical protein